MDRSLIVKEAHGRAWKNKDGRLESRIRWLLDVHQSAAGFHTPRRFGDQAKPYLFREMTDCFERVIENLNEEDKEVLRRLHQALLENLVESQKKENERLERIQASFRYNWGKWVTAIAWFWVIFFPIPILGVFVWLEKMSDYDKSWRVY